MHAEVLIYCWFWLFVCHVLARDYPQLQFYLFLLLVLLLLCHILCFSPLFLHGTPFVQTLFFTTQHNKSTVRCHHISTSHHRCARRIRSFLLPYQRSQWAGWAAASGQIASRMVAPEVEEEKEEAGQGAWWCLAWADIPYPSGRSPWTSGTVRGQKQGGGCCRPSVPPPLGRTRPRRAPTASRSTSQRPRLDSERPLPHFPSLTISVFLWARFWIFCGSLLFVLSPPFSISITSLTTTANFTSLAH